MWSSTSDVQGGYPTQWALNPSAYQNVSNEEVDWASLAQQWIKMKETFPAEQVPPAPPPPPIGGTNTSGLSHASSGSNVTLKPTSIDVLPDIEGGEAPMDMDTKEDNDSVPPINSSSTSAAGWGSWNNWQQWNWGNNWQTPAASTAATASGQRSDSTSITADGKSGTNPVASSFNFSGSASSTHTYNPETSGSFDYNNSSSVDQFSQQGYWMGGSTPYIRPKSDWRQDRHLGGRVGRGPEEKSDEDEETVPVIDAAKRKQLPAWIREGLEKMEKEKLKKQEKERMMKERELELARQKEIEQNQQNTNQDITLPPHSKFDSETEESDDEEQDRLDREVESQGGLNRRSRFDQSNRNTSTSLSPPHSSSHQIVTHTQLPPPVYISKEQIMQETMKKVRIVLTDILMSVTSEELEKAAYEVLTNMRAKAPAKQHRKTPALTSLTGKLGLGIYNSDDSEASDNSDNDNNDDNRNNGIDSDQELKERYQRRKQEFARIESDIINSIEEQEERERRQMLEDDRDGDDRDDDKNNDNNDYEEEDYDDNDRLEHSDVNNTRRGDDHQVEAKHPLTGNKGERRNDIPDSILMPNTRYDDQIINHNDRRTKGDSSIERSEDSGDDDDDDDSSESSDSSSHSRSSGSRSSHKRKKYSSKRRKEKKVSSRREGSDSSKNRRKRSRTRSRSRVSDRKNSSHRRSSHESYRKEDRLRKDDRRDRDRLKERGHYRDSVERPRTRDHSRSRDRERDRRHYSDSYSYRRHTPSPQRKKHYSSSSSHRRRRSSSSSDSAKGSRRSGRDRHRSRD